jgi:hypothetical protein
MAQLGAKFIGSISEATLRTQDLLPRFIDVLRAAEPMHDTVQEWDHIWDAAATLSNLTRHSVEDVLGLVGYWDSDDASYFLNDDVFEALNAVAPEGTYFGSSEGDGASFGFWYMDCDVCGGNLGDHTPEGQGCDDPDFDEDAEIVLAEGK